MNPKQYVARSAAIATRMVGDETLVMSAASSTLFSLDEVASVIWESADGVTTLYEIIADKVCKQYDVSLAVALSDAEVLVQGLAQHGLLLLSDNPIVPSGNVLGETR